MGWVLMNYTEPSQVHQASGRVHQRRATVRTINITLALVCELTYDRSLKRELVRAQEEIKRIQSVPLVIGQFMEAIDQK